MTQTDKVLKNKFDNFDYFIIFDNTFDNKCVKYLKYLLKSKKFKVETNRLNIPFKYILNLVL